MSYCVYVLTDPRFAHEEKRRYRYIGEAYALQERYQAHISHADKDKTRVDAWILELRALGLTPGAEVIANGFKWRDDALAEETRYIKEYLAWGAPLLNVHHANKYPRDRAQRLKTHEEAAVELDAFIDETFGPINKGPTRPMTLILDASPEARAKRLAPKPKFSPHSHAGASLVLKALIDAMTKPTKKGTT